MDLYGAYSITYSSTYPAGHAPKSSAIPGASLHSAIYSMPSTTLQDNLISFLSYVKTQNIPILPVTLPDVRSGLGQGASFLVNGAEMPETYIDQATGVTFPKGLIVAFKRAIMNDSMTDIIANRIGVIYNEVLTMRHPPLLAHPNIVKLLGIGFEVEGPVGYEHAMPVLIPECAELGNLAEVLETARKEDRPLDFDEKLSLCIDVAHGLEVLHACDIVHGDVKCENVLIFEDEHHVEEYGQRKTHLTCKLTDFGVSRHPSGGFVLGGSLPWQAPECSRGAYFKVESAKCTDVYSFGMLLWRVMLNGDPFKTLGEFGGKTAKEKRQQRNDAVALLKKEDRLIEHVCNSLETSGNFSHPELEMLFRVIKITLVKDPMRRELDIGRIIRFLTSNNWYQRRHPVAPTRISMDQNTQLLDIEKYYSEFKKTSEAVKTRIARGFRDYAEALTGSDERDSAAAFQLAICYAIGFGVPFQPRECLKWLYVAARRGSHQAQQALPLVAEAFDEQIEDYVDISAAKAVNKSATNLREEEELSWDLLEARLSDDEERINLGGKATDNNWSILKAAEACRYDILESLLSRDVKPDISEDGVTALHFLSTWDVDKAERLGQNLIRAGVDINAKAKRGASVGGTPLMWSVYGDHLEHSAILIKLGADPMADVDGVDALSFAVRLHLFTHLRLLLENIRPAQLHGHMSRLLEAAASGESRFARITRHKKKWEKAPMETFRLLQSWNSLFPETVDFTDLLLPALHSSLNPGYGRMNADIQIAFIDEVQIEVSQLTELLRESVVSFNRELFDLLLDRNVPVMGKFEGGKTLLHLCAKIPDYITAATAFAPRLLALGTDIEARDDAGYTPFMDAVLERKWDLADLLAARGSDPLAANDEGYNVLGLSIKAINCGSIKYLLKYCETRSTFHQNSFLVNPKRKISALQEAALIPLPREHGMKMEVMGVFLLMLANFGKKEQFDFRSDGILVNATALEIAASKGNVLPVKSLTKMKAHLASGNRAVELARASLSTTTDYLLRKNLERCIFILENWDIDEEGTKKLADDWTNMRTIDESHVRSSWELIVWDYKVIK